MLVHISVYTELNQVYLSICFLYRSISYYTSQWKSLGKSLGDCDDTVKVPKIYWDILRYTEIYWDILISAKYISVYTTGHPHQAFYFVTVSVLWHNLVYLEYIFLAQFPCYATTAVIPIMAQIYSVILRCPGGQLSRENEVKHVKTLSWRYCSNWLIA